MTSNRGASVRPQELSRSKCFKCDVIRYEHVSEALGSLPTKFHIIAPCDGRALPVLYYLSGLTCSDENFVQKAGGARYAAEHSVIIVCPDTSPRGAHAPAEEDDWDFGTGAGFYVDATTAGYSKHYRMYSFVTEELPQAVKSALGERVDIARASIFGHSMGGHGALVIALRNKESFRSVSAFAPIVNPCKVPWGEKCFLGYLGEGREGWKEYDATEIVRRAGKSVFETKILIDQGDSDVFLEKQLKSQVFVDACKEVGQKVDLRMQKGYDHSYFFISTFLEDHVKLHAKALYDS